MPDKRSGEGTPKYYVRTPNGDYQPLEVGTLLDTDLTEPGGDYVYDPSFTCSLELVVETFTSNNYRKMHGRKVIRWGLISRILKST